MRSGYNSRGLLLGFLLAISIAPTQAWFGRPKPPDAPTQARQPFKASIQWSSQQLNSTELPAQWHQEFPNEAWWTTFDDPTLNQLMAVAVAANPTLASLQTRIVQADALTQATRSILFPQVDLQPSYLWQQYSKKQFVFPLTGRTFHSAQTPLNASYEIDIWGKNRDSVQMTRLGINTAKYAYASARINVTAQLATAYFQVSRLRALRDTHRQLVEAALQNKRHAEALFRQGQAATSQTDLAQQYVDQANAELDGLNGLIAITEQQLNTLMGRPATSTDPLPATPLAQIALPSYLQAGVPSDLISHRPDVARQESMLEMARLNIKVAKKSLLPTVRLTASTGYAAVGGLPASLFDVSNISSFISPSISQPIFRGGLIKNGITLRKAEYQQMLEDYRAVMLTAFAETENSLAQWQTSHNQLRHIGAQYLDVERQAYHARRQYDAGITGQPTWLNADIQRLLTLKALDSQKAQLLVDTVSVYKALGGGFVAVDPTRVPKDSAKQAYSSLKPGT
jgi:NodT family efflux transporter outer membrane factor (OMF) lipoprotein